MTSTPSKTPERGGQVGSADAGLLELEKRLEEARQIPVETDEEVDEKAGIQLGLERQIATGAAKGLTGIAVKLRLAMSLFKETNYGSPTEVGCTKTALETVDRLLKGGETGDDAEVFELHAAWKRLEEAAEKTDSNADWQAAFAAEERFLKSPARTVAGLLFKLKVGCEPRNYSFEYPDKEGGPPSGPLAVLAVLHDLERMAGGAA